MTVTPNENDFLSTGRTPYAAPKGAAYNDDVNRQEKQKSALSGRSSLLSWFLLASGPLAGLGLYFMLPYSLAAEGRAVAGCALWMAIWWMTEAIPIPVTALLPLGIFPFFGIGSFSEVAAPYANSVIFLVLGGVILGLATEKSGLHLRIALLTIRAVGTKSSQIVLGLMLASAFVSAWVSNTATAVIMVPIATSILALMRSVSPEAAGPKFAASMLIGVAYGVTIGSTMTLIGQPPMALMKAYLLESHQLDIAFGDWMLVGVPWGIIMLFIAWVILTKFVFKPEVDRIPGGKELIASELAKLGKATLAERRVGLIFILAIVSWVFLPLLENIDFLAQNIPFLFALTDPQIAVLAAIACFIVPASRAENGKASTAILDWSTTKDVPWGLLLLFGGGLSLSAMFTATGFSEWLGNQVASFNSIPKWLLILIIAVIGLGLTELTSNTATAAAFLPVFGAVAVGIGIDPLFMTIAVTLAVCSAYMLPVATPSNAVAFGSGAITIKQMVRAGIWLNLVSLIVLMGTMFTLIPLVFDVSL